MQGQRHFFGAHTYCRVDREGTYHTLWSADRDGSYHTLWSADRTEIRTNA